MDQYQGVQGIQNDQYPYYQEPMMEGAMVCKLVYPEVYYRLQPHIMMVCDEMDVNYMMPTQEMIEQMSDNIYNDVCRMYPDMEEYARSIGKSTVETARFDFDRDFDRDGFRRRGFRRRGLFPDLIEILLLNELFGRRRRFFW